MLSNLHCDSSFIELTRVVFHQPPNPRSRGRRKLGAVQGNAIQGETEGKRTLLVDIREYARDSGDCRTARLLCSTAAAASWLALTAPRSSRIDDAGRPFQFGPNRCDAGSPMSK